MPRLSTDGRAPAGSLTFVVSRSTPAAMIRRLSTLFVALALAACSPPPEDEPKPPKVLQRLGGECKANKDCGSELCLRGVCSRWCNASWRDARRPIPSPSPR